MKPFSTNRDDFVWGEEKRSPLNQLSDKIEEYIEDQIDRRFVELFYGADACMYGASIFVDCNDMSVRFELKSLLESALLDIDESYHDEDKQSDIDELLSLLRSFATQLEERETAIKNH